MNGIKVPGVVWAAALVALSAFLQANFEQAEWYQVAAVVVAALLKYLDVNWQEWFPPQQETTRLYGRTTGGKWSRWLMGG